MDGTAFKHNDPDDYQGIKLTLHDCVADRVSFSDGVLSFYFPDGFLIADSHAHNSLGRTVRTDAAQADFRVGDGQEVTIRLFTKDIFRRTMVKYWDLSDFCEAVNSGRFRTVFLFQYRSHFEQMWQCAIHTSSRLYFAECQIHLPAAQAVYRWNNLCPDS